MLLLLKLSEEGRHHRNAVDADRIGVDAVAGHRRVVQLDAGLHVAVDLVAARERDSRVAHSSRLSQLLSGAEILSAFDTRRRAVDALARQLRAGYAQALSSTRYSAFGSQATEFIRIAGVLAVLLFGAESLEPGAMIGAIPLLFLLYSPVAELARLLPQLARGRVATALAFEHFGKTPPKEGNQESLF